MDDVTRACAEAGSLSRASQKTPGLLAYRQWALVGLSTERNAPVRQQPVG